MIKAGNPTYCRPSPCHHWNRLCCSVLPLSSGSSLASKSLIISSFLSSDMIRSQRVVMTPWQPLVMSIPFFCFFHSCIHVMLDTMLMIYKCCILGMLAVRDDKIDVGCDEVVGSYQGMNTYAYAEGALHATWQASSRSPGSQEYVFLTPFFKAVSEFYALKQI